MYSPRIILTKILDTVELLVRWATVWAVALIVLGSPLMIIGLQLDATGAHSASRFLLFAMIVVCGLGIVLALADLALRVRTQENIFLVMQTAWNRASKSRTVQAMSPILEASQRFMTTVRALVSSLLSLGFRLLGGILLAAIIGFVIYQLSGLLSMAPWWAIVIIALLLVK